MNVAVFGLGKLGQPMAVLLARAGHEVAAYDIDPEVRKEVTALRATVDEPMLAEEMSECNSLYVGETVQDCVVNSTVGYVIVPTPTVPGGFFSNQYVLEVIEEIGRALRGRTEHYTLVICSTVMPGSMEGEILSTLMISSGRLLGDSDGRVSLVYSPQFIALGSVLHDMRNPDVLLIGTRQKSGHDVVKQIAESTWDGRNTQVWWLTPVEAEITKIGINTYITNKITFGNVIGQVCAAVPDADGYRVARAIGADSRIGTKYILPGGPYGGPCFPRDTDAFAAFVDTFTSDIGLAQLAHATSDINDMVVERVVRSAIRAGKSKIVLLGLGYKPASSVTEESFGVRVHNELVKFTDENGLPYDIHIHDRFVQQPLIASSIVNPVGVTDDPDVVSIVCNPEPEYAQLIYSTVIDVWGIVPDENTDLLINYRDGNGNYLLTAR